MSTPRPSPSTPKAYVFPDIHRHTLDNGLSVVAVPMPGKTLCAAAVVTDAGAAYEDTEGTANLLARAFNEGTSIRDAAAFADASEALGMQLSAAATWDTLALSITAPKSRLAAALALMSEATWTPGLPQDGFDRLKAERLVQIQQENANPGMRAAIEFAKHAFSKDSTYSRSLRGTSESVEQLSRDELESFHSKYVSPGSSTLVVAGDVDPDWVFDTALATFGGFTREEAERQGAITKPGLDSTRIVLVDRPGSVQSQLMIGHDAIERTNPELDAAFVLVYAFGGAFTSRINQRLREELGYTYGAGAGLNPRRAAGPFMIQAPVQANATADAIKETLQITKRTVTEGITDAEAAAAREYLAGVHPLRFETTDNVVDAVANLSIYGLPDEDVTEFPERMLAITTQQASNFAATRIRPDQMLIVVVGPAEEIQTDLEAIAPVTVVKD